MTDVLVRLLQDRASLEVLSVVVRVSEFVEVAADRRLRLIRFGPDDAVKSFVPFAHVSVASEEVHRAGAEPEELRHPGVVVVVLREMAVGAILRRPDTAGGVREMGIEGLPAVTFRGEGLRLGVNPFPILILRADHDRAGRTQHRHAVFLHRAVDPEHENIVAHYLRIVGGEVPVHRALELVLRHALVRLHREMAAETAGGPRGVADLAIHRAVVVREFHPALARFGRNAAAPGLAVAQQRFRIGRFRIVMRGEGINRVDRLRHFPTRIRRHDRLLVKLRAFPDETRPPWRVAVVRQVDLARIAGSNQRGPLITRSRGNRCN